MANLRRYLTLVILSLTLVGCGGGNSNTSSLFGNGGGGADSSTPLPSNGFLSLSWTAPVSRTDGTSISMTEIGGYRIRYGAQKSNLNKIIIISSAVQNNYSATMPSGLYYLSISAYDTNGIEGPQSATISKTI